MRALSVTSRSADETRILGAALAPSLAPGDVVSLSGDLGAGKTVFVQGVARSLGVEQRVTSPSFTLVHQYAGRYPILHIDVYRLDSFQEVLDLGFDELLSGGSIVLVEWGEAIAPLFPEGYLDVVIEHGAGASDERGVYFRPNGGAWITKLQAMRSLAETLLDAASKEQVAGPRFRAVDGPPGRDDRTQREAGPREP